MELQQRRGGAMDSGIAVLWGEADGVGVTQQARSPTGRGAALTEQDLSGALQSVQLTRDGYQGLQLTGVRNTVYVTSVQPGSPAQYNGFARGHQLLKLDGQPITSSRKLAMVLQGSPEDHVIELRYNALGFSQVDNGNELHLACGQAFDQALSGFEEESFALKFVGSTGMDGSSDTEIQTAYKTLGKTRKVAVTMSMGATKLVNVTPARTKQRYVDVQFTFPLNKLVQSRCSGAVVAIIMAEADQSLMCYFFSGSVKTARACYTALMKRASAGFRMMKGMVHSDERDAISEFDVSGLNVSADSGLADDASRIVGSGDEDEDDGEEEGVAAAASASTDPNTSADSGLVADASFMVDLLKQERAGQAGALIASSEC